MLPSPCPSSLCAWTCALLLPASCLRLALAGRLPSCKCCCETKLHKTYLLEGFSEALRGEVFLPSGSKPVGATCLRLRSDGFRATGLLGCSPASGNPKSFTYSLPSRQNVPSMCELTMSSLTTAVRSSFCERIALSRLS